MHALVFVSEEGDGFFVWDLERVGVQDEGMQLMQWVAEWEEQAGGGIPGEEPTRHSFEAHREC